MNYLEQLEFKLEKLLGFRNMKEKLENCVTISNPLLFIIFHECDLKSGEKSDDHKFLQ